MSSAGAVSCFPSGVCQGTTWQPQSAVCERMCIQVPALHMPLQGQMLGSNTAADEPPMPGDVEVLLEAMQVCNCPNSTHPHIMPRLFTGSRPAQHRIAHSRS